MKTPNTIDPKLRRRYQAGVGEARIITNIIREIAAKQTTMIAISAESGVIS